MKKIPITTDEIPCRFDIELAGIIYTFEIKYNVQFDFFTADLLLDDAPIVYGKKLMLNQSLFSGLVDIRLPQTVDVVPRSNTETRISWDNLGSSVFLAVEDVR
jgi:hypothetical protein